MKRLFSRSFYRFNRPDQTIPAIYEIPLSTYFHLVRTALFVGVCRNDRQDPPFAKTAQGVGNLAGSRSNIAIDQLLGPDTGRVFNDASADIAAGNITPEQAAKTIEKSWEQNKE